jgi:hypothetical protein
LVWFDQNGTPYLVGVKNMALVTVRPIKLDKQNLVILTELEAVRFALRSLARSLPPGSFNLPRVTPSGWLVSIATVVILVVWAIFTGAFTFTKKGTLVWADTSQVKVISSGDYRPIAPPSISLKVFSKFLQEFNSPALSEAEAMYRIIVAEGGDPAFALAFFEHESSLGKSGVAVYTKSIGNIRCTPGYQCYYTQANGAFRQYQNWSDGAQDWVRLLKSNTYLGRGLLTIDQIMPVYAPTADKNNPIAYAQGVKDRVENLRNREIKENK